MSDVNEDRREERFARSVGKKEERKLRARREKDRGVWFGLGMFGLVGWSVAVPTLLFLALGIWIDRHYASRYSWTLMLLVVGIAAGCMNAWYWIRSESRSDPDDTAPPPDADSF